MPDKWSAEQRQRAAIQIEDADLLSAEHSPDTEWLDIAIDLRCSLNFAQEQIEEARNIIEQYPRVVRNILGSKPVTNVPHLESAAEVWLALNPKEKGE